MKPNQINHNGRVKLSRMFEAREKVSDQDVLGFSLNI